MVLLILTNDGITETIDAAHVGKTPVWVNAGLIGPAEVAQRRADGLNLTVMAHWIDPYDREEVEDTVSTIREHHPHQMICVEWPSPVAGLSS